jgi:NADPH:quinone reductase-like Zn-dependent oxidoreductase
VVAIGPKCRRLKIGQHVAVSTYGLFAEYVNLSERLPLPVPSPSPATLTLLVSGLTASIALHRAGGLDILSLTSAPSPSQSTKRRVVLVTAAAGGTGLFAVQLAKLCGCHVIGTCSSDDKSAVLKQLGCDRVINYKKESLAGVLKKEYPKGLDIVYEWCAAFRNNPVRFVDLVDCLLCNLFQCWW